MNYCIDCSKEVSKNAIRCNSCAKKDKNNPMFRKYHSRKSKQKMSESHKGDKNPTKRPEVREKISKANKGRFTLQWFINKYNLELGPWYYKERCDKISKLKQKSWNELSYDSKHRRLRNKYGKANYCEWASTNECKGRFEWANISSEYLEDINDWIQLCKQCHFIFDVSKGLKEIGGKK